MPGCVGLGKGIQAELLHNLQGRVQNENVGPLVQKLLRISRWQQKSIKLRGSFLSVEPCARAQVAGHEAILGFMGLTTYYIHFKLIFLFTVLLAPPFFQGTRFL